MRGGDDRTEGLFSYVSCEARVPATHPLRLIRALVDEALELMSPDFEGLYSKIGRPSIPPEKLLRALLLQAFYSIRSERQLMEQMDSATDHRVMNAVLDTVVQRFQDHEEEKREKFRGQLKAYRNLYAFLSQIIPYQDSDLERLYAFVRNLLVKLPPPGDGQAFVLDDEVGLRFFRLQQMSEGSIDLSEGESDPLKGPTDIGTARAKDEEVALSSLIDRLNERFGTHFNEADQLFFDQIRISAENDETIAEAARANNFANFAAYLDRMLDELFIARMEGNEEIFSRVMTDTDFRSVAHDHLAREIFRRVRDGQGNPFEDPAHRFRL